jgi:hypothetical protein
MRSIAIAFVAALVAAPALSAQQAADQAPAAQTEVRAPAAPVAPAAVPATVAPPQSHLADMEVVQPRFSEASDTDMAVTQVDNRTRNLLAIVGVVVIVIALVAFLT